MSDLTSTSEDLAKWREVFVDKRAGFITVDGWVGMPAIEQVQRAVDDELLAHDENLSAFHSDEQYTAFSYRPTEKLYGILRTPRT